MDATFLIKKIHQDYEQSNYLVNGTIKYTLNYNGYPVTVMYSKDNNLSNALRIIITVDRTDYLLIEYIYKNDDNFEINTFIDNEIYNELQFSFFQLKNKKCPTEPFFDKIKDHIIKNEPVITPEPERHYYQRHNNNFLPYFETVVRHKMSNIMRQRIIHSYPKDLAYKILEYCKNTYTLRFTEDENRAKDIVIALELNKSND